MKTFRPTWWLVATALSLAVVTGAMAQDAGEKERFPAEPDLKPPPTYPQPAIDPECASSAEWRKCVRHGCWVDRKGRCSIPCEDPAKAYWGYRWTGGSFNDAFCRRTSDTPCDQTPACQIHGICGGGKNVCWFDEDSCKDSTGCEWFGTCIPSRSGCVPRNDDDCRQSRMCRRRGECFDGGKQCRTRDAFEPCAPPKVLIDGTCLNPVGYDCRAECEEERKCHPLVVDGSMSSGESNIDFTGTREWVVCVESDRYCSTRPDCPTLGECSAIGGKFSHYNKCDGYPYQACGDVFYGGCHADSPTKCEESVACRLHGRCGVVPKNWGGDECHPTKPEHCQKSVDCKRHGKCGLFPISGYNICAATEARHCLDSEACEERGLCRLTTDGCAGPNQPI